MRHSMKSQRGCKSIVLAIHPQRLKVCGVSTPQPCRFAPQERDPASICQDACWASGPIWTGKDNLAAAGVGTLDPSARSELLRLLSHPCRLYSVRRRFSIAGFEKVLSLGETMVRLCWETFLRSSRFELTSSEFSLRAYSNLHAYWKSWEAAHRMEFT
jgi:hypothetical protein